DQSNCESDQDENEQNDDIAVQESSKNNYENDQSDQSYQVVLSSNHAERLKITKSKSSFQNSWLSEFKWLQYDKISQRMFCKY
ncbi:18866_t:CDS:1, partial [Dentiscutata erythropus]